MSMFGRHLPHALGVWASCRRIVASTGAIQAHAQDTQCYDYRLPKALIADKPVTWSTTGDGPSRDESRLLCIDTGGNGLRECAFKDIYRLIPRSSLMVVNDTLVIQARLKMAKQGTGGAVEALLVSPDGHGYEQALGKTHTSAWKCMIKGCSINDMH